MPKEKRWKVSRARKLVMRELVRRQFAPVPESEVTPLLLEIRAAITELGLPETDADWFYKKMLLTGWKWVGVPVMDWRFTIAIINKHQHFPSQR